MQPTLQITASNLIDHLGRIAPYVAILSLAPAVLLAFVRRWKGSPAHSAIALESLSGLFLFCAALLFANGSKWTLLDTNGSILRLIGGVWLGGAALSLSLQFIGLVRIWLLVRAAPQLSFRGERIYALPQPLMSHGALVFFNRIFVDPAILEDSEEPLVKAIIAHETVHIRQFHWVRTLLSQILASAFWWALPLRWSLQGLSSLYEATADSIAGRANPVAYVESLLWLARRADGLKRYPVMTLGIRVTNQARWDRLLESTRPGQSRSTLPLLCALAGVAAVLIVGTAVGLTHSGRPRVITLMGGRTQALQIRLDGSGNLPNSASSTSSPILRSLTVNRR